MKKILFLFAMLAGVAASAQSGVTITPVSADYAQKKITFRVSWANSSRTGTHLSKVWVFVDYRTITGSTPSGNWMRALISGTPTANAGTSSRESGNDKGFWLQGTSGSSGSYNATVTVTLSSVPARFSWCAYASDYPPNARITTGTYKAGTYTLKGTKPFTVNGTVSVNANTYSGGSITSITDATQCPGYRCGLRDEAPGTMGCCAGLTAIGGGTYGVSGYTYTVPAVCRDLSADAAQNHNAVSKCRHRSKALPCGLQLTMIVIPKGGDYRPKPSYDASIMRRTGRGLDMVILAVTTGAARNTVGQGVTARVTALIGMGRKTIIE